MNLARYLRPALAAVLFILLGTGWYWFEHHSSSEDKEATNNATVVVTKSINACFSDLVRVTGYVVPRREAVAGVDQEGSKVTEVLVREGETVAENQELARLTPPPGPNARNPIALRAPAAGLVTQVSTIAGAP